MFSLRDFYRNIEYFIYNVWNLRRSLWEARPWDYSGTLLVLRDYLSYQQKTMIKYSNHTTAQKEVHNIKICLALLERILKDEYLTDKFKFEHATEDILQWKVYAGKYFLPKGSNRWNYKLADARAKQDKDLLFQLLNKHIKSWWY